MKRSLHENSQVVIAYHMRKYLKKKRLAREAEKAKSKDKKVKQAKPTR